MGLSLALGMGAPFGEVLAAPDDASRGSQSSNSKGDAASEDPVEEAAQIADSVSRMEKRFQTLRSEYEAGGVKAAGIDLQKRYDEGVYAYLVEDYGRSSLLFYTLLDRADRATFPDYPDVEWYLAESLFLDHNYHPALEYYTRIVKLGPGHPHYTSAVVRMVETYGLTGDTEKFEAYYQTYMSQNAGVGIRSTDKIEYAFGKTLFLRGDYDRSRSILGPLAQGDSGYAARAGYIVAASDVAQGELDRAITSFETLLGRSINTPEQREVEDLAYLALGRIYLEQGAYDKAITSYQNISRYSARFADALYELSSTYYRMGDLEQALRTLDILLLTSPDSVLAPDLKLRRGLLLQDMNNYNEALDTYERLIAEYTGVTDEFDNLMRNPKDVLKYFNELVGTDLSRVDSSLMVPTQAIRFIAEDQEMARALEVARVLREEQSDLIESDRLIQEIEGVIEGQEPRDLVLHIKRVRQEVRGLRDGLLVGAERLVVVEYQYLERHIPAGQRGRLDEVVVVAEDLPQLATQLPELDRDRTEKVEVYSAQIDEVERNIYKLERMIEDLIAQAASIEKYLSYTREEEGIDPDTEQSTRLRLGQERSELEAALKEIDVVLKELEEMKFDEDVSNDSKGQEDQFRRDAVSRIDRMKKTMAPLRSLVTRQDAAKFFASVDESYAMIVRLSGEIDTFFAMLDRLEVQEIDRIRRELAEEKTLISGYAQSVQSYDAEAKEVSEQIAYASFSAIQKHFSSLILNANVGIIDVYWEQKEAKSDEIDQLQADREAGIRLLQEKFSALQANQ